MATAVVVTLVFWWWLRCSVHFSSSRLGAPCRRDSPNVRRCVASSIIACFLWQRGVSRRIGVQWVHCASMGAVVANQRPPHNPHTGLVTTICNR